MERFLLFFTLLLAFLLANFDSFGHMFGLWWTVDTYNYGLLIPIISAWLISDRWNSATVIEPRWTSLVVILGAEAFILMGEVAGAKIVQHLGFFAGIAGIFALSFGWRAAIHHRFALLFLFLAVPFGEDILPGLQLITAEATIDILRILGVPLKTEGVLIYTPFGNFEVARACAGVRFFLTSVVVGVLLSHLIFVSRWRKALIILVAAIVPIIANIVRVVSIILIARESDIGFAKGIDHIIYGWVFLSLVLALIIGFAYWLSDLPKNKVLVGLEGKDEEDRRPQLKSGKIIPLVLTATFVIGLKFFAAQLVLTDAIADYPPPRLAFNLCVDCPERRLIGAGKTVWSFDELSVTSARFRHAADIIEIGSVSIDARSPDNALPLRSFKNPLSEDWSLVPGVGGIIETADGRQWLSRGYMVSGQKILVFTRATKDQRIFFTGLNMKIELSIDRLLGEWSPVDLIFVTRSNVRDWRDAQKQLTSFIDRWGVKIADK